MRKSLFAIGLLLLSLPAQTQSPLGSEVLMEDFKMTGADADSIASVGWSVATAGIGVNAFAVGGAFRGNASGPETGAAYVFAFDGFNWVEEQKLLASDAHANDSFGQAATAYAGPEGKFIVVGAPKWPSFGMQGASYLFSYNTDLNMWEEEVRLVAADGEQGDHLGNAVAIVDSLVLASATLDDDIGKDAGAVYAFRRRDLGNGNFDWVEEDKLTASDAMPGDAFGRSVDIARTPDGDALCVIGPSSPEAHPAGALYVFGRIEIVGGVSVWEEEAVVTAQGGADFDHLGWSAAISATGTGTFVLGGAPGYNGVGPNSGAAYIFRRQDDGQGGYAWVEETILIPTDAATADAFGWSVSLVDTPAGLLAIAGTRSDDNFRGAAYAFIRRASGDWEEIAKLIASDGESGDFFGYAVNVSSDWAFVGAPLDDRMGGPAGRGAVYAYDVERVLATNSEQEHVSEGMSLRVWPNPFNELATVSYQLDEPGAVELAVFDVLGRAVVRVNGSPKPAGEHVETIELGHLPAGRYLLRLTTSLSDSTSMLTKLNSTEY